MKKIAKESAAKIMALIDTHNAIVLELQDKPAPDRLPAAIGRFNANAANLRELIDAEIYDIDEYMSERSERWQDGERGQAYQAWRDELEAQPLDEIDAEDIEAFDADHLEEIDETAFPFSVEAFL